MFYLINTFVSSLKKYHKINGRAKLLLVDISSLQDILRMTIRTGLQMSFFLNINLNLDKISRDFYAKKTNICDYLVKRSIQHGILKHFIF